MVVIDHGYGIQTRYAHNTSLLVHTGDWVEVGEVIATVGSTGQSTGPHLHFELLIDGQAVDPLDYLPR
jgi:murein DD-endopeptidase MepM/ murein hydrolase activator NlpD